MTSCRSSESSPSETLVSRVPFNRLIESVGAIILEKKEKRENEQFYFIRTRCVLFCETFRRPKASLFDVLIIAWIEHSFSYCEINVSPGSISVTLLPFWSPSKNMRKNKPRSLLACTQFRATKDDDDFVNPSITEEEDAITLWINCKPSK